MKRWELIEAARRLATTVPTDWTDTGFAPPPGGVPTMEALANGKPVACIDCGGAIDPVSDYSCKACIRRLSVAELNATRNAWAAGARDFPRRPVPAVPTAIGLTEACRNYSRLSPGNECCYTCGFLPDEHAAPAVPVKEERPARREVGQRWTVEGESLTRWQIISVDPMWYYYDIDGKWLLGSSPWKEKARTPATEPFVYLGMSPPVTPVGPGSVEIKNQRSGKVASTPPGVTIARAGEAGRQPTCAETYSFRRGPVRCERPLGHRGAHHIDNGMQIAAWGFEESHAPARTGEVPALTGCTHKAPREKFNLCAACIFDRMTAWNAEHPPCLIDQERSIPRVEPSKRWPESNDIDLDIPDAT